jgi:hypothetical protein
VVRVEGRSEGLRGRENIIAPERREGKKDAGSDQRPVNSEQSEAGNAGAAAQPPSD